MSTCLLDIRSRNSPDPSSQLLAWTLVLAFPRAWSSPPQSVPAAQGLGQPLRVLCTVLGDSTAPGWVLSQLQLQWPSQAHIPNPGPPLGEHLSSLDRSYYRSVILNSGRMGRFLRLQILYNDPSWFCFSWSGAEPRHQPSKDALRVILCRQNSEPLI